MLRITHIESKEEAAVEKTIIAIRDYYRRSTWRSISAGVIAISDNELETIRKHLYQALEQKVISIEELYLLHLSTIQDLFNNIYGIQGLSEKLFTLSEADETQNSIFQEFLTEKGIAFLRNTKGQTSITDLAKIDNPHYRSAAIDIGYLDPVDVTVQRLCNNLSIYKIADNELSNIRQKMYEALEEKIVPLADLQKLSTPLVRDVFGNKYGDKIFVALQEGVFTLPEIDHINTYAIDELMTEKGIALLKNLKENKIPLKDFVNHLEPHERTSAIKDGHVDKAVIEQKKRISEERAAQAAEHRRKTNYSDGGFRMMRPM